ncbi:hypothetical protein GUJ93_ZPchr0013g35400 [Zizania palustris]|uniref:Uncharacterized protein n=1 Tax=Zizania palustris TaxID=103762 RepID=A0A8J6BXK5_ZIZPA|nr:hypothetical protein GUJ93_ZPchr0013g35400 [Zizania palustris]
MEEQRGTGAAAGDSGGRRREAAGESATTSGDSAGEWGVGGQREIRLGDGWSEVLPARRLSTHHLLAAQRYPRASRPRSATRPRVA